MDKIRRSLRISRTDRINIGMVGGRNSEWKYNKNRLRRQKEVKITSNNVEDVLN